MTMDETPCLSDGAIPQATLSEGESSFARCALAFRERALELLAARADGEAAQVLIAAVRAAEMTRMER